MSEEPLRTSAGPPVADDPLLSHPFDHYQRFQPIREILDALRRHLGLRRLTVLDVGGADGALSAFLPDDRVIVTDPGGRARHGVVARGEALPYADGSFDAVVSVDTLEHVPTAARAPFLREACRVSRGLVAVAAPFDGDDVAAAEDFVERAHRAIYGSSDQWLVEHAQNGLPAMEVTLGEIARTHPCTRVVPNGYLPFWRFTMALNYALLAIPESHAIYGAINRVVNERYYPASHRDPSYRKLVVALRRDEPWLDAAVSRLVAPAPDAEGGLDGLQAAALGLVSTGLAASLQQKLELVRQLEDHIGHQQAELAAMEGELARAQAYAAHVKETHAQVCAEMEALQVYTRHVEAEFQKAAAHIDAVGVQGELARQHARGLEERLGRLEGEIRQRELEIQELRRGGSMRRTLRRLIGEPSKA